MEFFDVIRKMQMLFMHAAHPIIAEYGLSKTEIFVLMSVYHKKGFRVTDLARMADVPASTFTGIIDRLVQREFIVRVADPQDRRSVLVQGTQVLQDTIGKVMEKFDEVMADVLKPVPAELIQNTVDNLKRIYEYTKNQPDGCTVKLTIKNN